MAHTICSWGIRGQAFSLAHGGKGQANMPHNWKGYNTENVLCNILATKQWKEKGGWGGGGGGGGSLPIKEHWFILTVFCSEIPHLTPHPF